MLPKKFSDDDSISEEEKQQKRDVRRTSVVMLLFIGVGIFSIIFYVGTAKDWSEKFALFGTAGLIAGSSLLIGCLLGFLFGIPRTLQESQPPIPRTNEGLEDSPVEPNFEPPGQRTNYQVNTNLEQISDWLTKILVGVGLTELHQIPNLFQRITNYLSPGFQDTPPGHTVVLTIIVYFLVCGFLSGYLLTRLFIAGAFSRSDQALKAARKQISRLVELNLDLEALRDKEKEILSTLIERTEKGEEFKLGEDFERESDTHEALRSLRRRYLVKPKDGGSWRKGKIVELTPIGHKAIKELKQAVK